MGFVELLAAKQIS